jgi:hypothetical protein
MIGLAVALTIVIVVSEVDGRARSQCDGRGARPLNEKVRDRPVCGGPRRALPFRLPEPRVQLGLSHVRSCDED